MVCINFDKGTDRVVEKSIDLAAKTGAELHMLHIAPEKKSIPNHVTGKRSFPEIARRMCKCNNKFEDLSEKIKEQGIKLVTKQLRGDAASEIIKYAKNESIDMIVMGALKSSVIRHFFNGSVVAKVMNTLALPVFLVPNKIK